MYNEIFSSLVNVESPTDTIVYLAEVVDGGNQTLGYYFLG